MLIPVESTLPIYEAVMRLHGGESDILRFEKDGEFFIAHRDDLGKMAAMGLDTLPLASIAIPEQSSLLSDEHLSHSSSSDYSRRLSEYFPVYFVAALYELQSLLLRFNIKGYVIGGITRDLLLFKQKRREVRDVDITVEGDALALAEFLAENSRNFEVTDRFPEFGTAKVRYKDSLMFDFASTREEVYPHCGALPVVVKRGVPLIQDVVRRDFTVNALAFSVHALGQVLDYTNGIRDIQARRLSILHPVSFFEDPSRILRALKFCARFDFELAEETQLLMRQFLTYGHTCYKGGGERIKQELKGLLSGDESPVKSRWIRFFVESGCYRLLNMECNDDLPEETVEHMAKLGEVLPTLQNGLSKYTDQDFVFDVYLCFLFRDMSAEAFQSTAHRLGLTKNEREFVEQFRKLKDHLLERFGALHEFSAPAEIYDLFNGLHFIVVAAALAEIGENNPKLMNSMMEAFLKYKRKWETLKLELDGNDLLELGVPEGKKIGKLLDQLLHAKLAGQVPERLDEIQYVQNCLSAEQEQEAASDALPSEPA